MVQNRVGPILSGLGSDSSRGGPNHNGTDVTDPLFEFEFAPARKFFWLRCYT